ncbi:formate transporter [Sphingomonas jejuensis]|uniref:Formate transporter n=1 Tax=Sphingomonas jejuensis TaxID=904715 RepID=A0ABX0XK25_9SPHN|nr:formate/nitrite transporter family protein [Sphingomonas jejuensis]NJC33574.1 formate transporter [Sphingomonas jejuensis]
MDGMQKQDAVGPEIADAAPDLLAKKVAVSWPRIAMLGIAAGAFIAFGSIAYLIVQGAGETTGAVQLLSGAAFSIGLMLVVVTAAELFTGDTMLMLPAATGKMRVSVMLGTWAVVWLTNLIGSLAIVGLFLAAGGLNGLDGGIGEAAAATAATKLGKGAAATLASGILANMLVCLAVWMAMGAKQVAAKLIAVVPPVTLFVAAGFEHSIANMSLLPLGLAAAGWPGGVGVAVASNLALSTAGNILGGAAVAFALGSGHGVVPADDD